MSSPSAVEAVEVAPPVKACPKCSTRFTLDDLLGDADISPIGMLFLDDALEFSAYYFNHVCAGCGTTFTVPIQAFRELIVEPIPDTLRVGQPGCEGHCVSLEDLQTCSQPCANAPFRRFLVSVLLPRRVAGHSTFG